MSQTITLGQSVRQATRFLREIQRDVFTLMTTLDELMQRQNWHPTEKSKISSDLSNALTTDRWTILSVYRIYAPQRGATKTDKIVAIQVEFDPPDSYEEAICLLVAARFPTPTSYTEIWNHWRHTGSVGILQHLADKAGAQKLDQRLLRAEFLPEASAAEAFTLLLCDLNGTAALDDKIVSPLLRSIDTL